MSGYLTISRSYLDPSWKEAERYAAREKYLALVPRAIATNTLDTLIGLISGVAVLCTFGLSNAAYNFHARHIKNSKQLLATPFRLLLLAVNTNAAFPRKTSHIPAEGDGFTAASTIETIQPFLQDCLRSPHFFHRHITTRLTHIALAVCCIAHRAIDAQIGALTAPLALITFGKIDSLNNLAYRSLQAPGIINDLVDFAIKIINPFAGHAHRLSGGILANRNH